MSKTVKLVSFSVLLLILIIVAFVYVRRQQVKLREAVAENEELKGKLALAEAHRLSEMSDWPQLRYYADANAKLQPPRTGEMRVVFMGDSITDNWDDAGFGGFFPEKPYINRGISGQTSQQMLARFRQDVISLNPEAVVILAGINDMGLNTGAPTLLSISNNLESMAELASVHKIQVILASVLPVSDYNRGADGQQIVRTRFFQPARIVELNNWIKDYAARKGYIYMDYYSALVDERGMLKADLADDGLHPNARGYAVMRPLAEQTIEKALKNRMK